MTKQNRRLKHSRHTRINRQTHAHNHIKHTQRNTNSLRLFSPSLTNINNHLLNLNNRRIIITPSLPNRQHNTHSTSPHRRVQQKYNNTHPFRHHARTYSRHNPIINTYHVSHRPYRFNRTNTTILRNSTPIHTRHHRRRTTRTKFTRITPLQITKRRSVNTAHRVTNKLISVPRHPMVITTTTRFNNTSQNVSIISQHTTRQAIRRPSISHTYNQHKVLQRRTIKHLQPNGTSTIRRRQRVTIKANRNRHLHPLTMSVSTQQRRRLTHSPQRHIVITTSSIRSSPHNIRPTRLVNRRPHHLRQNLITIMRVTHSRRHVSPLNRTRIRSNRRHLPHNNTSRINRLQHTRHRQSRKTIRVRINNIGRAGARTHAIPHQRHTHGKTQQQTETTPVPNKHRSDESHKSIPYNDSDSVARESKSQTLQHTEITSVSQTKPITSRDRSQLSIDKSWSYARDSAIPPKHEAIATDTPTSSSPYQAA